MSLFDKPGDILLLRDLLSGNCEKRDSSDDDDDVEVNKTSAVSGLTPGNVVDAITGKGKGAGKGSVRGYTAEKLRDEKSDGEAISKGPKTMEEFEAQQLKDEELLETRKRPQVNISYRQAVGTEDVFLQINNRSPSTASCEDMVVEIDLEGDDTPVDKMNLIIHEGEIALYTKDYALRLQLPQKIDVDKGKANYDSAKHILSLTLRMKREFDFVNF